MTTTPFTSPFTAPFNCFAGANAFSSLYNSSIYGGMGSPGGYGGYGHSAYGMNMNSMCPGAYSRMGTFGQLGMPSDPTNPSVTQAFESTTATTFTLLQSVVQTFAGLAQMLESTFMATHSSFLALAGVVDQFAQLRNALGGVLGLFDLVHWLCDILTGRRANSAELGSEFRHFLNGHSLQGPATRLPETHHPTREKTRSYFFFFITYVTIVEAKLNSIVDRIRSGELAWHTKYP